MKEAIGNLLSVKEGIIVHGCNAQGVMGSGVAAAVRAAYPGAYEVYRAAHQRRRQAGQSLEMGSVVWFTASRSPKLAIANAITQEFFGRDPAVRYVDYDAVRMAFRRVAAVAREHGLAVHYPQIGAGLGNGDWSILSGIIATELGDVPHTLWTLPAPQVNGAVLNPRATKDADASPREPGAASRRSGRG